MSKNEKARARFNASLDQAAQRYWQSTAQLIASCYDAVISDDFTKEAKPWVERTKEEQKAWLAVAKMQFAVAIDGAP